MQRKLCARLPLLLKKSKSDRRHISKAVLVSRSDLNKAQNLGLQKEAVEAKKLERKATKVNQELLTMGVNGPSSRKGMNSARIPEDLSLGDNSSTSEAHTIVPSSSCPLELSTRPSLHPINCHSLST